MIEGHLDAIRGRAVLGWAWDSDAPTTPVTVTLAVDGVPVKSEIAGGFRPDLLDAGKGDGIHAYEMLLPEAAMDGGIHVVAVVGPHGLPLAGAPVEARLAPTGFQPLTEPPPATERFLTICAIARDEAPYLLEWIAFHRLVGVEHFLIFDNGSVDGTGELLAALEGAGIVTAVPWTPADVPPQPAAYREGLDRLAGISRWVAVIDLDEFLMPLREERLPDILADYAGAGALAAPWRIFGSAGETAFSPEPVTWRFTFRAEAGDDCNRAVKSIVRPDCARVLGVHTPELARGQLVDENFAVVGSRGDPDHHVPERADRLVVNHYFCKSRQEWAAKRQRGRANQRRDAPTFRRGEGEFDQHDRNAVCDTRMLAWREALRAEMARLTVLVRRGGVSAEGPRADAHRRGDAWSEDVWPGDVPPAIADDPAAPVQAGGPPRFGTGG